MATTPSQEIEHLRKLSQYRERPECDPDGVPYYASTGYRTGTHMPMLTQPGSPHREEEDQDDDL